MGERPIRSTLARASLFLAVVAVAGPGAGAAQSGDAAVSPAETPGFCIRGGPPARCSSFLIMEAGGAVGVATSFSSRVVANATWELGWMANRADDTAMGGTAVLMWHDRRLLLGAKYRYRRWLNDWLALDAAPGLVTQVDGKASAVDLGLVGHVGLSAADWVSVVAQVEALHVRDAPDSSFPVSAMVGLRAGSYPAVGLSALFGLVAWWASRFD